MTKARSKPLTLDELPLFATDAEIAEGVVGRERADYYRRFSIPSLEKLPGYPPFDESHGGRYVPAVKAFYERRLLPQAMNLHRPDMPENHEAWRKRRSKPST